jgi:anti-sigma regulatory factor (Ser/Thr protein kinase)
MREIALHILDIAQNSVVAGAKNVRIDVVEDLKQDMLEVVIKDDGCGMSPDFLMSVTDPFTTKRTTRKVGLGIPLFKLAAENTGGLFGIESEVGKGTTVTARFVHSHIDRQPLGDMPNTILGLVTAYEAVDFIYCHRIDQNEFYFDTSEIRGILGEVPFSSPDVYMWLLEYLTEGENDLIKN